MLPRGQVRWDREREISATASFSESFKIFRLVGIKDPLIQSAYFIGFIGLVQKCLGKCLKVALLPTLNQARVTNCLSLPGTFSFETRGSLPGALISEQLAES